MNEKMNGGISTMRGIFCRLSFQKGGITAETIAAQGFDGGIFSVDTRQKASKAAAFDAFSLQKRWKLTSSFTALSKALCSIRWMPRTVELLSPGFFFF